MNPYRWSLGLVGALLLSGGAVLAQQRNVPHVGYVYPAGGKQGSELSLHVGGQALDGVSAVHVSGRGVTGSIVEHTKPLTPVQFGSLREQLKELTDRKAAANATTRGATQPATRPTWTAEDDKKIEELRKKLMNPPNRQVNPALAETVLVQMTIDPQAEPGPRELRLETPQGLTNPVVFCVGQLPEFAQPEFRGNKVLTLPATVNGQIMPGAVDRLRFQARGGQQVVVAVGARSLMPYISDAVPGWFQAAVAVYDAKGKELAFADHFRSDPDPILCCDIPADGEYTLEIRDLIYRGREDFVYRVAIGELPVITGVFPLGAKVGDRTTVELTGWNLPSKLLTHDASNQNPGLQTLAVSKNGITSNRVPFVVDNLPECAEQAANHQAASAQKVTLPIVINGRVDKPGEWHVFRFEGRAGENVVAEVTARRLGSPLDSCLRLTDTAGKELAFNDDTEDPAAGLITHHADSWLRATLPADGTYYVYLADTQQKAGPDYAFRLRLSAPRPDFELRITPSSVNLRGGASVPLTVFAVRRDGFAGEIALNLKDAPAGFTLSGGKLPAGQDQVKVTLRPATRLADPIDLQIEGRATIDGRPVTHAAVPADDLQQAFSYRHLVPAQSLLATTTNWRMVRMDWKVLSPTPLKLQPGKTARLLVAVPAQNPMGKLVLELSDPPAGLSIQSSSVTREGTELVLQCDAAKAKPGAKGNLIVMGMLERNPMPGAPGGAARRVPVGTVPAVPFEIAGP